MARGRGGQPADLGRVLDKLATALGLRARLGQEMVLLAWPAVVGKEIARITRPQEMRGGVLVVRVRTSTWANQLTFFKDDIINRLNQGANTVAVSDIRWVIGFGGPVKGSGSIPQEAHDPPIPGEGVPIPLTDAERDQAEVLVAQVADDSMRMAWRQFVTGEISRRAWRRKAGWQPCPNCEVLHRRGPELCPACRYSV